MTSDAPGEPPPIRGAAAFGEAAATSAPLRIEGEMTIQRAVELRDALLGALDQQGSPVDIDLSAVNEIDTAGVQLLLLAKRTALARHKELHLVGQSAALLQVFETLNLVAYFGAPEFFLFSMEDSP